jgi:hypothetical protein
MTESYCRSCYRPIAVDSILCSACERTSRPRWPLVVGAAGLPLLIIGMLTLNVRLCAVGAAIAALGAVGYVISLR